MTTVDANYIAAFNSPQELLRAIAREYIDGHRTHEHWHEGTQLIYASSGVMELACGDDFWLISPQQALWMPALLHHRLKARGTVQLRTVYLRPEALPVSFPSSPQSLVVSPLLRELVLKADIVRSDFSPNSREVHLMQLLLDEIFWANEVPLRLRMPKDGRLQKICLALMADPSDQRSLDEWGYWVGASSRTLSRLFQAELGSSFALWRQHAKIFAAIPRLDQGEAISRIAADLGYESASAFSTAFRRIMAVTPRDFRAKVV